VRMTNIVCALPYERDAAVTKYLQSTIDDAIAAA